MPQPLPLGPGWEGAEQALAALQADLSRTVPGAPPLLLLWCDDDEALPAIASQLQDAVVDGILGSPTYWPLCPEHASFPLGVAQTEGSPWSWVCLRAGGHPVSVVGHLAMAALT